MDRLQDSDPATDSDERQVRTWAMAIHLSQLANFVVPLGGIVAPIVIWQVQKDKMPSLDEHGKIVVNWMLSLLIYFMIAFALVFVLIGFAVMAVLGALAVVFPIIGGIKANQGEVWRYPGSIRFF
ncbi:MAG TPA: DUF4870 domain-containing protein [Planctomicrobium sp.]|nr:DUF4870 domain-containing protein [Planctomicrobium sp.]